MLLRGLWILLAWLALLGLIGPAHANAIKVHDVLVVTSDSSSIIEQTAQAILRSLELSQLSATLEQWGQLDRARIEQHHAVITLGQAAAEGVARLTHKTPILASMVSQDQFEQLCATLPGAPIYGLVLDQPAERQIATIKAALPDWKRIALITSADSTLHALRLADAAQAANLAPSIEIITSEQRLFGAMQGLLQPPAVLVLLPDRSLYNSHTIQNVLLTTYRYRSPVLGLSSAYSRAGALLAVFSTPEQIARQSVELVRELLDTGNLPRTSSPAYFEIAVNRAVARSLGIQVAPTAHLHYLVSTAERDPEGRP